MRGQQNIKGQKDQITVLYDGYCPVCRRSARLIRKFDVLNVIDLKKYQEYPLDELPVSLEKLGTRIQACDADLKNCREGIFALTSILARIPPLFPFAAISFILGLSGVGQKVYDYISENRYNLPFSGISSAFFKH